MRLERVVADAVEKVVARYHHAGERCHVGREEAAVAIGAAHHGEDAGLLVKALDHTCLDQALGDLPGVFVLGLERVDLTCP